MYKPTTSLGGPPGGIQASTGIKASAGIGRIADGPSSTEEAPVRQQQRGEQQASNDLAAEVARLTHQISNIRIVRGASADHVDASDNGITILLKS